MPNTMFYHPSKIVFLENDQCTLCSFIFIHSVPYLKYLTLLFDFRTDLLTYLLYDHDLHCLLDLPYLNLTYSSFGRLNVPLSNLITYLGYLVTCFVGWLVA